MQIRDTSLEQFGERAILTLVNEFVELTRDDRIFDFTDVSVPGPGDLHEEVEGDFNGAVTHVATDPLEVAMAIAVFQGLEGDVLDQAPVDDRLITDCSAVIDLGSGRSQTF